MGNVMSFYHLLAIQKKYYRYRKIGNVFAHNQADPCPCALWIRIHKIRGAQIRIVFFSTGIFIVRKKCLYHPCHKLFILIWNLHFWKLKYKIFLYNSIILDKAIYTHMEPLPGVYVWNKYIDKIKESWFELNFRILKLDLRFQINSNFQNLRNPKLDHDRKEIHKRRTAPYQHCVKMGTTRYQSHGFGIEITPFAW